MKLASRILMKFSCILSLVGLGSCALREPLPPASRVQNLQKELSARVESQSRLRVLFIGNSYSFGVSRAFAKVAAAHHRSVKTGHSTYGGWTLAQHAKHDGTLKKIRSGKWDIVVIQEHSLIPAHPAKKRDALMFGPLRFLVNEARAHGAIPVLYQTWGRRDGNDQLRADNFQQMTSRLREGYHAAAKFAGGVIIVPVGDAWEREMQAGRGHGLFTEDGSHPSPAGDAITAATFYRSLYEPYVPATKKGHSLE